MNRIALLVCPRFAHTAGIASQAEAESALANILFDEDMENVAYSLPSQGFVDTLFGPAINDQDRGRILNRVRAHPDIPGVQGGRCGSNFYPVK